MKKTVNNFTAKWEPMGKAPQVYEKNTYKMQKMQRMAYDALADKKNVIINAPTASGKTLAICWMVAKRLSENETLRAIVTVPQTIIADGFRGKNGFNLEFPDGSHIGWCPRHFLCDDNVSDSNLSSIRGFLEREGQKDNINDRILVCSHLSLVIAFQKFPALFKNLVVVIDEAHHISLSEGEEIEGGKGAMVFCNQMGGFVATALKEDCRNVSLVLSTATWFRGDGLEIVGKHQDRFVKFFYPMDEYLKDCQYLRSFSYDFAMYSGGFTKRLTELFDDRIGKTIVYVPHPLSTQCSSGSKNQDVINVYRAIAGKRKYIKEERSNGMTEVKRGDKWIRVVNLVDDSDPSLRCKRKKLIIDAHKHPNGSVLDVVITLNMFREGANWKWADREIIIGTKGSLTDMSQIIGRLFRDAKGKGHIQTVQLLPFAFDQIDKEQFRADLNDYMKVIFATMLLEEAIQPFQFSPPVESFQDDGKESDSVGRIDYLREAVRGDDNKMFTIRKDIMAKAVTAQDQGEMNFGCNNQSSRDKFTQIVSAVLSIKGIASHHQEISKQVYRLWQKASMPKKTGSIDLSTVDFDTIQINPLDFILAYTSDVCGLHTFGEFRRAIKDHCFWAYQPAHEYVLKLGLKNLKDWQKWASSKDRPLYITSHPDAVYNEFTSWGDWLGTGAVSNGNRPFKSLEDARKFGRGLNLKTNVEWRTFVKSSSMPDDMPANPDVYYKDRGWIDWGDFLGFRSRVLRKNCMPEKDMIRFMADKGIASIKLWEEYIAKNGLPDRLPKQIDIVYGIPWEKISGKPSNRTKGKLFDFDKSMTFCRVWAKKLRHKNGRWPRQKDWGKWCNNHKRPLYLPRNPLQKWPDRFRSFGYFFGTGSVQNGKVKI